MKYLFRLLMTVCFPISVFAQKTYFGYVVNKKTKEAVPYATIGFVQANSGINANEVGYFTIDVQGNENDTLTVSSVGYNTLKMPVTDLHDNINIELNEKQNILKEVIVRKAYKNSIMLNKFTFCSMSHYATIYKIAQHFTAPTKNALLSEISICKTGKNAIFRIQVYDMDSITKNPNTELSDTIIEIQSEKKRVTLNVEQYNIIIPNKNFFIAVEWLRIPENAYTDTYTINGEKKTMIRYEPMIAFKGNKGGEDNITLRQHYSGEWENVLSDNKNIRFLISAKLKY